MANFNSNIDQTSAVIRKVIAQATGREDLAGLDTKQLLTIGEQYKQAATRQGMADPVLGTISQMVTKTVFSSRPYKRKFAALKMPATRWGNVVRKLKILDKETDVKDNQDYDTADDGSTDMYKRDNTKTLQLNFVGQKTHEIVKTIYAVQYDTCFNSEEEFARFIAMVMTYVANKVEKIHEETARAAVSALIAGRVAEHTADKTTTNVVYLISEYNKETGLKLDATTVYQPDNFKPFMEWAYAYISDVSDLMTEYSDEYQTQLADGQLNQHTPQREQVAYFYTHLINQCSTRVLTNQFNKQLMQLPGFEKVNFWQSIKPGKRDQISVTNAVYLGKDGAKKTSSGPVTVSKVFGILADRDALGYSPVNQKTNTTPYNAAGDYYNIYWKFWERSFIDFTEKSVVFLLDVEPGLPA